MDKYLPIHFVSYSSLNEFHACPRRFDLTKNGEEQPEFENINFCYGHSVGAGVQELFTSGDLNKAILKAFLAWDMDLFHDIASDQGTSLSKKKTFPAVVEALHKFYGHYLVMSHEWELFFYEKDGVQVPAVELSAKVELPHNFVYRIFIDLVLRSKKTGELLVFELKTDGMKWVEEAKYANSNQALSYSVILDRIQPGNTSFVVWYAVYYTSLERWEFFPFSKSRLHKANWIRTVLYDTGNINYCNDQGFFPKQGESCLDFGRPCRYYGTCDMSNLSVYAPPILRDKRVEKELEKIYDYTFTLEEIVDQQLEGVRS